MLQRFRMSAALSVRALEGSRAPVCGRSLMLATARKLKAVGADFLI
jgi:hypothetical protein